MADISDVERAMVTTIAAILDLGSKYVPGSPVVSPVVAHGCKVYRGWPVANELEADERCGVSHIAVFPVPGASRNTTRYLPEWRPGVETAPSLIATVSGATVTFGGAPSAGQVVGIRFGGSVTGSVYAYRVRINDKLSDIATALAAQINGATASGPTVTVPGVLGLEAKIAADQPMWRETRRQQQHLWVMCWCPDPIIRDKLCGAIDAGIAGMTTPAGNLTEFIALSDGTAARVCYASTQTIDKTQQAQFWRRDLRYTVEFGTTLLESQPRLLFTGGTITDTDDIIVDFGDVHVHPSP